MIPRYAPTYTYNDLFRGLGPISREKLIEDITNQLSNLCNMKYVYLVKNARSGIYAILKAYDRKGGVVIPAYNCISVPEAVNFAGYKPVFVDITTNNLNAIAESFEKLITPEITVVIPTHLFGIPCEMDEILNVFKQRDILVIEDAAPGLGAEYKGKKVGCFGDASVISFGGRKVIYGEAGGAILTNNEELSNKIREILFPIGKNNNKWSMAFKALANKTALTPSFYGIIRWLYNFIYKERMYEIIPGKINRPSNYLLKIPDYACALIDIQMDRLNWNLKRRRTITNIYKEQLNHHAGWILPVIPASACPSWIQFPMICENKSAFYKHMKSEGIDVSWTYKYSCAESFGFNECPNARQAAKKVISLPTTPFITDEQAYQICAKALKYST